MAAAAGKRKTKKKKTTAKKKKKKRQYGGGFWFVAIGAAFGAVLRIAARLSLHLVKYLPKLARVSFAAARKARLAQTIANGAKNALAKAAKQAARIKTAVGPFKSSAMNTLRSATRNQATRATKLLRKTKTLNKRLNVKKRLKKEARDRMEELVEEYLDELIDLSEGNMDTANQVKELVRSYETRNDKVFKEKKKSGMRALHTKLPSYMEPKTRPSSKKERQSRRISTRSPIASPRKKDRFRGYADLPISQIKLIKQKGVLHVFSPAHRRSNTFIPNKQFH